MNIGIFLPNWIGDTVMCTPALRALRGHFGEARLTGILRPGVVDVLAGTPWLDGHLLYDHRSQDASLRVRSVVTQMRARKFDAIVLMTNSLRSGVMARLSGAQQRVGYVRYGRGPLLTHKLFHPRFGRAWLPTPAIDSYLQLAYALGCASEAPRLELATQRADELAADAVWHKCKLPHGERVVVLNSGGAYGAAKLWPTKYFARLARRIASQSDLAVLVVCGPAERAIARQIVSEANHPRVASLADEPVSVGLTKACIRRSRLLVTTDSGPRFFGVAFGVPVVALFGPTHTQWSRTHYERETRLQHAVPCGPCGKRTCPLDHHDCMRLLSVERVYEAVFEQLKSEPAAKAA